MPPIDAFGCAKPSVHGEGPNVALAKCPQTVERVAHLQGAPFGYFGFACTDRVQKCAL